MDKMLIKLIAAGLSLMLAVTVAVTSSYAWLTLSDNPAANGIYIAIGGGVALLAVAVFFAIKGKKSIKEIEA